MLWLYPTVEGWTGRAEDLPWLLPEITPGGRRSLVAHLQSEQYLVVENVMGESSVRLTDHGLRTLEAEIPALSASLQRWDGVWAMLIFLTTPKADPRFRNLRKLLVEQGAGQLSRGVYLYPGEFPPPIQTLCQQLYRGNVVISSVNGWQFGDERSLMNELFLLSDAAEIYSGISSQTKELLGSNFSHSQLNHSPKVQLFTVFDRLANQLNHDLGLVNYYFPQVPKPLNLLADLHNLTTSSSLNQKK